MFAVDNIVSLVLLGLHIKLHTLKIGSFLLQVKFPYILRDSHQLLRGIGFAGELNADRCRSFLLFRCFL